MIKDVIKNAKIAKEFWSEYSKKKENQEVITKFNQFFHIRPTTKGCTIVSTHPERPMNGIEIGSFKRVKKGEAITKQKLQECIEKIAAKVKGDKVEWEDLGFKNGKIKDESRFQAYFINEIIHNAQFKEIVGVENLYFIGSEIILQEKQVSGGGRPDVVAHDGKGKIILFELKVGKNKKDNPIEQVNRYIKRYQDDRRYQELLLNYPAIKEVEQIDEYIGWAVGGDEGKKQMQKVGDGKISIS